MKGRFAILAVLLCGFFLQARAQEKILAVTEEFAPFNYTENGKVTGYSTRVVEEMFRRAGLAYELNSYPWSRTYKLAQTLPNVVIFTMARTPEREKEFQWIGALAKRKLYLYKLASRKDIQVEGIADAKKYWTSANRDDADFITGSDYTVGYLLQKEGIDASRLQRSIALVDQGEYFVAASKNTSPEIVRRLRAAYEQMEKEGVIRSMQPKFE